MKQIDLEALIDWDEYFQTQAEQGGHGMMFQGSQFQRGYGLGSIFQSLFRFLVPIGKTIGRAVGQEALHAGTNLAGDLLDGAKAGDALKTRGREAGKNLVNRTKAHLAQSGSGAKKMPPKRKPGRPKGSKNKPKPPPQKKKKISPVSRSRVEQSLRDIFG